VTWEKSLCLSAHNWRLYKKLNATSFIGVWQNRGEGKKQQRNRLFIVWVVIAMSVAALRPSIRFWFELVRLLGYFIIDRL
jgi:hypothetical protein